MDYSQIIIQVCITMVKLYWNLEALANTGSLYVYGAQLC